MNGWMYGYELDRWKIWDDHEKNVTSMLSYDIMLSFCFDFLFVSKEREKERKMNKIKWNQFFSCDNNNDKIRK